MVLLSMLIDLGLVPILCSPSLFPHSLSPQILQEILSIRQLYNGIMQRVQHDRQQLIRQLQQVLNNWSGDSRATDEQMSSLAGRQGWPALAGGL
jgi:hypothetical protein